MIERLFRIFNIFLGLFIIGYFIQFIGTLSEDNPDLNIAAQQGMRTKSYVLLYFFPIASALCLILPDQLSDWLSSKASVGGDSLLTPGFFYIAGYILLGISAAIYFLYQKSM